MALEESEKIAALEKVEDLCACMLDFQEALGDANDHFITWVKGGDDGGYQPEPELLVRDLRELANNCLESADFISSFLETRKQAQTDGKAQKRIAN